MSPSDGAQPQAALEAAMGSLRAPAPPPMFGFQPNQKKPKGQPFTPTFLGSASVPQAPQLGKATLLGAA